MYLVQLSGLKIPLYAIHKYVANRPRGILQMLVPNKFAKSPDVALTSTGKPFVASNRTGRISDELRSEQIQDEISKSLEGYTPLKRGSRTRPSILKYPVEIGSGQVPHVMQFKVFWRWENKDLKEGLKAAEVETEKKIGNLKTLASLIENGQWNEADVMRSPLSDEGIAALQEIMNSDKTLKIVDPSMNDSMATMLNNNPQRAKQILEETISSYQTRLSDISSEISNGAGKIGPDEMERLQLEGRFGEQIADSTAGSSAVSGSIFGALVGGGLGFLAGGFKGLAAGAVGGGAAGAVAAVAVQQGSKLFANQAVYDQMVSIYLPFCTKINNEDTFQYEDPSMGMAGGLFDALGNPLATTEQAAQLALNKGVELVGGGQAGAVGTGRVVNPRLEKLFKQKDFRNFNFSWEFYPKTKDEVEQVRNIIETFRYHAHPSRENEPGSDDSSKVQVNLRVPGEFEVRFLSSNPSPNAAGFVENEYLPSIGRCSLTSISVDYTPNSIYSSFQDNSPTAIVFSLQFSEMGLLTREAIDKGY
tara:strand:- start:72775 stop:74370 length:1596 start_codon:yes stop_codon:yes gene_type:complete